MAIKCLDGKCIEPLHRIAWIRPQRRGLLFKPLQYLYRPFIHRLVSTGAGRYPCESRKRSIEPAPVARRHAHSSAENLARLHAEEIKDHTVDLGLTVCRKTASLSEAIGLPRMPDILHRLPDKHNHVSRSHYPRLSTLLLVATRYLKAQCGSQLIATRTTDATPTPSRSLPYGAC